MAKFLDEYRKQGLKIPMRCDVVIAIALMKHHIDDLREYFDLYNKGETNYAGAIMLGYQDIQEILDGLDRVESRLLRFALQNEIESAYQALKGMNFPVNPPRFPFA